MSLQQYFRIGFVTGSTIRLSFKSYLELPLDVPSPDHSAFSRFRKRVSKEAMIPKNSVLLKQFHRLGRSINEGVAVDAGQFFKPLHHF